MTAGGLPNVKYLRLASSAAQRWQTLALIVGLAIGGGSAAVLDRRGDAIGDVAAALQSAGLNREDREEETVGYYEAILDEGGRMRLMNPGLGDAEIPVWGEKSPTRRARNDFLLYDLRPNVRVEKPLPFATNSDGFVDREYSHVPHPGIRRIALIGDSITQGYGAGLGQSYEAQLEDDLVAHPPCAAEPAPEILNFAVSGYHLTQLVDALPSLARPYRPDAYVVALTELSLAGTWSNHLTMLIREGRDLKYAFLKDAVRASRVLPTDPQRTMRAKLARYRWPILGGTIMEMQRLAEADHADFLVLLVPNGRTPRETKKIFEGVPEFIQTLPVPYVNLLDTFSGVDISTVRVSPKDPHPNTTGHALLYRAIRARMDDRSSLLHRTFLGNKCEPSGARALPLPDDRPESKRTGSPSVG